MLSPIYGSESGATAKCRKVEKNHNKEIVIDLCSLLKSCISVGKKIKDWKIEPENDSNIRASSGEISEAGKHMYRG